MFLRMVSGSFLGEGSFVTLATPSRGLGRFRDGGFLALGLRVSASGTCECLAGGDLLELGLLELLSATDIV